MLSSEHYPSIVQAILLLIFLFLLQVVGGIVVAIIGLSLGDPAGIATANVFAVGIILLWGVRRTRASFGEVCPFSPFPAIMLMPLILIVFGLGIVASEMDNLLRSVLPAPESIVKMFGELMAGGFVSVLCISLFAPITEELLFRGLILRGFLGHYSVRKAILASAIIFACFHLNPYQFFSGLSLGILLGWLFFRTHSLLSCLFVHSLYNGHGWIVKYLLHLEIPGYTSETFGDVQLQPLWFDLLGLLLCGIGFALLKRVMQQRHSTSTREVL